MSVAFVEHHVKQKSIIFDIGYDMDNFGAPTIYDNEAQAIPENYNNRYKVPWPSSNEFSTCMTRP